jgi:hypothetical protein
MTQEPEIDRGKVLWLLDRAKKQNAAARKLLDLDQDLAVIAAQEAMFSASLAWMLSHGERPLGHGDRSDIMEFVERNIPPPTAAILSWFYRIPQALNDRFYDQPGNDVGSPDTVMVVGNYLLVVTHLVKGKLAGPASPAATEQSSPRPASRSFKFLKNALRGKFRR